MLKKQRLFFITAIVYTIALALLCLVRNDGLPYFGTNYEDKIYHLIAYSLLCFLWYMVFHNYKNKHAIILAFSTSVIYGIIIEVLQGQLTTTRDASIADIVANTVGVAIVSLILTIRNKTIVKKL